MPFSLRLVCRCTYISFSLWYTILWSQICLFKTEDCCLEGECCSSCLTLFVTLICRYMLNQHYFLLGFFFLTETMCRAGDKHLIWPSNSNHLHVPILAMNSTTQMWEFTCLKYCVYLVVIISHRIQFCVRWWSIRHFMLCEIYRDSEVIGNWTSVSDDH